MKNNRSRGFTLIELLAVIVILAVIALIATPLIMNVINDAKKGAARDAGYNIIKAGELKSATEGIAGIEPPYHYDESSNLDLKGTKPTKMILDINKEMDTQLKAWLNGYCVVKEYGNETVTIDENKKTEKDCVNVTYQKYANGEVIYFNPETGKKCSDYTEANSKNENKSGCMKWYAFNDRESSTTVNVILDHNTTYKVAWNSSGNSADGMKEVKEALESDTSSWNASLKPRLIEANEIAKITGNTEFDSSNRDKDNWFYFENNSQKHPNLSQGTAKYRWLFDYNYNCTTYGCSIEDSNARGYWTSTPSESISDSAWGVYVDGSLYSDAIGTIYSYGLRPVVTISKFILS